MIYLYRHILIALLLLAGFVLQAQKITVYGTVTDASTRKPIEGAELMLNPGASVAVTNKKGEFKFVKIKPGSYQVTLVSTGYKTAYENIVADSTKTEFSFSLTADVILLNEITITQGDDNAFGISRLKSVEGTSIYAGKKSEIIRMDDIAANLATNNSRQIYSKVPGLNIWESDGAGIQLGIGGRGLSPNRTSNFNTRQNGYDISADALGYPESYYSPTTEAIERIEIVRGAASLQYGTQFGGIVNFKLKKGAEDKKIQLVSRQTAGSFNFYNTFNSIGGTVKKWNYYVFHQYKKGDGWRKNSSFDSHTAYAAVTYSATEKLKFTLEYTFMDYLAQQAGGLTDQLFEQDPQQSVRNRNWFKVNWNLGAFIIDYKLSAKTTLNTRSFGLLASRDALGILSAINRADPMQERNLLHDKFKNFGNETRLLHRYTVLNKNAVFLIGTRYYQGLTDRKQGNANSGNGPDFYYLNPDNLEHSDYDFPSKNVSVFTENIFYPFPKFSIVPGLRYEYIHTASEGYYKEEYRDMAGNIIYQQTLEDNRSSTRAFVLAGLGLSYKGSDKLEVYGNISQNYRSINFNDMRIVNPNSKVDPNLKDENGYSADMGLRGNIKQVFNYDISVFYMSYNDRIGSVIKVDSALFNTYRYRTNISDSRNYGLESFMELDVYRLIRGEKAKMGISLFTNLALLDARYVNSKEAAYENKKVELAPSIIAKAGISVRKENFKATYQYAYTAEQYTDATNAEFTSNAVNGLIPAYYVMDLSLEYTYRWFTLAGGINNLSNNIYFTRRSEGYPGPGILPSDGRNFYVTVQVKL
ncbi:MAG: carboxypeptidase-like regulatory domain-containing protein [Bacteroidia bacterium]